MQQPSFDAAAMGRGGSSSSSSPAASVTLQRAPAHTAATLLPVLPLSVCLHCPCALLPVPAQPMCLSPSTSPAG
jgi:hypothetical protein